MTGRPMPVFTESFLTPEPWAQHAACLEVDPDLFFPPTGAYVAAADAKRVCASCPVAADCLEYALRRGESHGIWGGLSRNERAQLRAERRTA